MLKFIIDVALFIDICSISILGVLLAFVIPRGGGPFQKHFLGLHRHEWGDIHLYLSLGLLCLLFFHIWFNRAWVVRMAKQIFGRHWQRFLWAICGAWFIVIAVGWVVTTL